MISNRDSRYISGLTPRFTCDNIRYFDDVPFNPIRERQLVNMIVNGITLGFTTKSKYRNAQSNLNHQNTWNYKL